MALRHIKMTSATLKAFFTQIPSSFAQARYVLGLKHFLKKVNTKKELNTYTTPDQLENNCPQPPTNCSKLLLLSLIILLIRLLTLGKRVIPSSTTCLNWETV